MNSTISFKNRNALGFTLIELLLTVSIIILMLGLAVPAFNSAMRGNAPLTGATEFANSMGLARQRAITSRNHTALVIAPLTLTTTNQIVPAVSYAIMEKTNDTTWIYVDRWQHLPNGAYFSAPTGPTALFPFPDDINTEGPQPLLSYEFMATGELVSSTNFVVTEGVVMNVAGTWEVASSNLNNTITGIVYKTTGVVQVEQ